MAHARQKLGFGQVGLVRHLPGALQLDVFVAQRLIQGRCASLVAGVNLPMLLRAVCYRAEPLDALVQRAMVGGAQGVMPVPASTAAPEPSSPTPCHDHPIDNHH